MADAPDPVPLVVDVDGTLIKTDLLHETTMQFVAQHPFQLWRLPLWLAGGRARVKRELAARVPFDVDDLPLRDETMAVIRDAQADGRPVYLASASDRALVERLADRVGGLAGAFGSDGATNVAGGRKADRLVAAFGEGGFDYVGDRPVDFPVWARARRALAVSHSPAFARRLRRTHADAIVVASPRVHPRGLIKAMRPHQWAKNLLIFLSLVAGHEFGPAQLLPTIIAFFSFCLAASSAYLLNDLLDLPGDRMHPRKRRRPFAAGDVPISWGLVQSALLMLLAIGFAALLPGRFLVILLGYVGLTLGYSLVLKRKLLVDVIVLGGLYTIRVLAGLAATQSPSSQWLLMFSLFLFLSLATMKRCSELVARREAGKADVPGRGYRTGDLTVLFPLAAAAGYGAVLVFALYLYSPEVTVLYARPDWMWLMCPLLLYWISRVLVLCSRDELHDDPVIFALTDRVSWATGLVGAAIIAVSV